MSFSKKRWSQTTFVGMVSAQGSMWLIISDLIYWRAGCYRYGLWRFSTGIKLSWWWWLVFSHARVPTFLSLFKHKGSTPLAPQSLGPLTCSQPRVTLASSLTPAHSSITWLLTSICILRFAAEWQQDELGALEIKLYWVCFNALCANPSACRLSVWLSRGRSEGRGVAN